MKFGINQAISQTITQLSCFQLETPSSRLWYFLCIKTYTTLKCQSGNAQFGSKLAFFLSCVTMKFDEWPLKSTGHLFHTTPSFVHHFKAIGKFELELQSRNTQSRSKSEISCLEIWWINLKNKRPPLLCHLKLCASFHSYQWNHTWVTVRKRPIQGKIDDFMYCVAFKFDRWPWKTIGHLFYATSSFVHHFIAICEFRQELQFGIG